MIRDYDKKMEVALDFYNQSQEILSMVHENIASFKNLYGYDLLTGVKTSASDVIISDLELQSKVATRRKVLLTDLGKVGEFTLKYIFLLKQMKDYPNQSIEEFNAKPLYGLADRGVRNTYLNQYHMDSNTLDKVLEAKDRHPLQPLHDYGYLFELLKLLSPETVRDIYTNLELCAMCDKTEKSQLPDWFKKVVICVPQVDYSGLLNYLPEERTQDRDEFSRVIRESGDVFTRLRYLTNNLDNKQYNLHEILMIHECLAHYARLIHEANYDDISQDICLAFSKDNIMSLKKREIAREASADGISKCCERIASQREFFDELFSIDRVRNSTKLIEVIGLYTSLSVDEIKELLNSDYSDDALYTILHNNLTLSSLQYLKDNGVSDVSDVMSLIVKNGISVQDIRMLAPEDIRLLVYLNLETLDYVKQYPGVYDYVKNSREVLGNFFSGYIPGENLYSLFRDIISMDVIQNNPGLIALLDFRQVYINEDVSGCDLSNYDVMANIRDNIGMFKNNSIFKKLPIMLDADNNKQVYEFLTINGFQEESIDSFDSTIFCFPIEFIMSVTKKMHVSGETLIKDGNVNPKFYTFVEQVRSEGVSPPKLPLSKFELKYAGYFKGLDVVK